MEDYELSSFHYIEDDNGDDEGGGGSGGRDNDQHTWVSESHH